MTETLNLAEILETARQAALASGQVIRVGYALPRHIHEKGPRDLVTDTDHASQAAALALIRARHPDHSVLAEEAPETHQIDGGRWHIPPGVVWIIDPLDGTTNFTTGLPISCVSVGVASDGVPVAGAIYDPYRDEMFLAAHDLGATLNGQPIPPLKHVPLRNAIVCVDWARASHLRSRMLETVTTIASHCFTVRALGSAALGLAYVACARVQLYFHFGLQPWDVAAAAILIAEAGGMLRSPGGEAWHLGETAALAAHPALLDEAGPLVTNPVE